MFTISRGQAIVRYKRDTRREGDKDVEIRHRLVQAWQDLWSRITAGDDTLGAVDHEITAAGTLYSTPMPVDFLRLVTASVDIGDARTMLDPVSRAEREQRRLDRLGAGETEFYMFGWDPAARADVMFLYPPLASGGVLRLSYIVQPPTFGDPDNPADDAVTLDVYTAVHYDALIAMARYAGANAEERKEAAKAMEAALQALPRALHHKTVRARGRGRTIESYQLPHDPLRGLR